MTAATTAAIIIVLLLNLIDQQIANCCIYCFPLTIVCGGRRVTICLVLIDCCMNEGWYCCVMFQLFHSIPTFCCQCCWLIVALLFEIDVLFNIKPRSFVGAASGDGGFIAMHLRVFVGFVTRHLDVGCRHGLVSHPPLPSCICLNGGRRCAKWMDGEISTGGPTRTNIDDVKYARCCCWCKEGDLGVILGSRRWMQPTLRWWSYWQRLVIVLKGRE